MATFLDPRFKNLGFATDQQRAYVHGRVAAAGLQLQEEDKKSAAPAAAAAAAAAAASAAAAVAAAAVAPAAAAAAVAAGPAPVAAAVTRRFSHCSVLPASALVRAAAPEVKVATIQEELHAYLLEPQIPYQDMEEKIVDPLPWWKEHERRFPILARLARRFLCTPATSVPSEHLFSVCGNIVTQKRASLTPSSVGLLAFLTENCDLFGGRRKRLDEYRKPVEDEPGPAAE